MIKQIPKTLLVTTAVPLLLLVYAVARWMDGADGIHGPGLAWDIGHLAFLGAFLGLGTLTLWFWEAAAPQPALVHVAAAGSAVGAALFCWVILTDLVPILDQYASLPDPVKAAGPPVFIAGFVALLGYHARRVRVRGWPGSSALTLLALMLVGADLDLLAVTALLMGIALIPVALTTERT